MDKRFLAILAVIVILFIGVFVFSKNSTEKSGNATNSNQPIGLFHAAQSRDHIERGQAHAPYTSDPASSGPHYSDAGAPALWGVYIEEVPDEVFVHNEEHGGVIVTYNPGVLSEDQIKKIQKLFAPPYSDSNFKPNRAIVTPRTKNTKPIELAAWSYTLNLDVYDQSKIEGFYLKHVNHAPEAGGLPHNTPINQAK